MARRFQARREPLRALGELLPAMCENLSLARAQISLDQVRGILQSGDPEQVVLISAGDFENQNPPLAAAVAIHPSAGEASESAPDSATIVHAGSLGPLNEHDSVQLASVIGKLIDRHLRALGVEFVQWSTDDISAASSAPLAKWCSGLGFNPLATLDYLSGPINGAADPPNSMTEPEIRFEALDWNQNAQWDSFAALVEQTYEQTHDCPMLTEYRTAMQALRGYRSSNAFAPAWWFRLVDRVKGENLGCLILGHHRSDDIKSGGDVVEIVYMGLVPSARGRGLGATLVRAAKEHGRRSRCSTIILAVDQRNQPARRIYDRAELKALFSETVWVKSLVPACGSQ